MALNHTTILSDSNLASVADGERWGMALLALAVFAATALLLTAGTTALFSRRLSAVQAPLLSTALPMQLTLATGGIALAMALVLSLESQSSMVGQHSHTICHVATAGLSLAAVLVPLLVAIDMMFLFACVRPGRSTSPVLTPRVLVAWRMAPIILSVALLFLVVAATLSPVGHFFLPQETTKACLPDAGVEGIGAVALALSLLAVVYGVRLCRNIHLGQRSPACLQRAVKVSYG